MRALPQNAFNYMQKSGGRPLFEVTNNDDYLHIDFSTLASEVQGHWFGELHPFSTRTTSEIILPSGCLLSHTFAIMSTNSIFQGGAYDTKSSLVA
jgi:hypothetical protein